MTLVRRLVILMGMSLRTVPTLGMSSTKRIVLLSRQKIQSSDFK
ncbi:LOW QUALITY PROTEIN: hypothetical protein TorRG33x02_055300 [Trema orientale]|uniref:Uncharacterized protein n=1 Tax=Trema orientale TaxID=63057 RepID=A0A2P5FLF4_TREOI|nr:LOW QUALITY PROTEIN: hypothetical protein TorRG33x02_055300 [Trema orientale]